MGSSSSVMVFDAEAAKALSELQKLAAAQRALTKDMREGASEASRGSKVHEAALSAQATQWLRNDQQIQRYRESLRNAGTEMQRTGQMSGAMRMNLNNLTFAADDFLTVLQQPGMGLIHALRASANNLSYILTSIHPLAGLIPVLGTSVITLGQSFFKAADGQKELANQADVTMRKLQQELEVMRAVGRETETRQEFQFKEKEEPLLKQAADLRLGRAGAMRDYLEKSGETLQGEAGAPHIKRQRLAKMTQEQVEAEFKKVVAKERQSFFGANRGFAEDAVAQVQDFQKQEVAVNRQLSLIQQQREAAAAERKRKDEERQREELTRKVREKLSPFTGGATQFAAAALAEGQAPETVEASLRDLLKGQVAPGEQSAMADPIREMMQSARGSAFAMQFKGPKTVSPEQQKMKQIDLQLGRLQLEEMQELRAARGPGHEKKIRDKFDLKQAPLEEQKLALQLSLKGMEDKQDTANDLLRKMLAAMEAQNVTVPPTRGTRLVPRNP